MEKEQFRDKAYHLNLFPKIKIPKAFDLDHVKTLDYKSRLEYVRDRSKLPEKTVFDIQRQHRKNHCLLEVCFRSCHVREHLHRRHV